MATLSKINSIHGKVNGLWYDTCPTIHATYDKTIFKIFECTKDGLEVEMGNETRSKVLGRRSIDMCYTMGKKVTLTNFFLYSRYEEKYCKWMFKLARFNT